VHLPRLPLTPNGKLDRKALPDPDLTAGAGYVAPAGETEEKLCRIWAEVLALDEEVISADSNFFDLGGHSLNAISLTNKIYKEINVKVPLQVFFAKASLRLLAGYIEAQLWLNKAPAPGEINKTEVLI
jgi:acyl carrier protein